MDTSTPRMKWTEENRRTVENEKVSSLKTNAPCVERFKNRGIYITTQPALQSVCMSFIPGNLSVLSGRTVIL